MSEPLAPVTVPRRRFLLLASGGVALLGAAVACQSPAAAPPTAPPAAAGAGSSPSPASSAAASSSPAAAPLASPSVVRAPATVTINFGSVAPSVNQMAPYLALKHGFLDEFGIKLQETSMQTSTDIVRALVGGSVDVAETSPPSLVVAFAKGASDVALIAGMVEKLAYVLMAGKDVKSYADLKGKTVGISSVGDGLTVVTRKLLAKGGLNEGDYDFVALGSSGQRFAGLESGGVAAVVISQPYDFQLQRDGYNRLGDTTEVVSDYSFIGFGAKRPWVSANSDAVTRMLAAFVKGQDFFLDPANRAASIQDMQDYVKMNAQDAAETYDLLVNKLKVYAPHLEPSTQGVQGVIDVSVELGDITPPGPSVASLLDLDALHAAQRLVSAG